MIYFVTNVTQFFLFLWSFSSKQMRSVYQIRNKKVTFVIKCKELIRVLERNGWYLVSVRGSHMRMKHPDKSHSVFPFHGNRDIAKGTFFSILKQAGIKWKK